MTEIQILCETYIDSNNTSRGEMVHEIHRQIVQDGAIAMQMSAMDVGRTDSRNQDARRGPLRQ